MSHAQTSRQLGLLSLLACAGTGYLLYIDRKSPVALDLVETQSFLPVPITAILGGLGTALILWSFAKPKKSKSVKTARIPPRNHIQQRNPTKAQSQSKPKTAFNPKEDWWSQVRSSCKNIELPAGSRITLERDRPCPVYLYLEMAPPERCKRAIRAIAEWFSTFSTPPRLRIEFDHCPEGPSPRHHMVNGALANHLDRGSFKVITDRDAVEVLFHRPDPRWNRPENTG